MKPRMLAVLAATVALPLAGAPALAQSYDEWRNDDRGGSYGSEPYMSEREYRGGDRMSGREYRGGDRYSQDDYEWDRRQVGSSRDRWANRPTYDREFDRRSLPPGYDDYLRWRDMREREMAERYRDTQRESYGGDHRHYDEHHARQSRDDRQRREYYTDSQSTRDGYGDRYDGRARYGQEARYERARDTGARQMRRASETIRTFDADDDQRVTQDEVDQYRADRLKEFDENQDGQLSLQEYEQLWLQGMRERMVDRFQDHDRDGDGQVTNEEFAAATSDMVRMRDRDGDGAFSFGDLGPRGGEEFRRRHGQNGDQMAGQDEDYEGRPEVEAPLGGSPNDPEAPEADAGSESAAQNRDGRDDDDENDTN